MQQEPIVGIPYSTAQTAIAHRTALTAALRGAWEQNDTRLAARLASELHELTSWMADPAHAPAPKLDAAATARVHRNRHATTTATLHRLPFERRDPLVAEETALAAMAAQNA